VEKMTTKQIIATLSERIYALVTTGDPVDVVVWRHPGETADEAIGALQAAAPDHRHDAKYHHDISCGELGCAPACNFDPESGVIGAQI
jgi:hypothetical protein